MPVERANVTVPEDVRDIVAWLVRYDPRFQGKLATALAELIRIGAQKVYEDGLRNATPLEPELTELFDREGVAGIGSAGEDQ